MSFYNKEKFRLNNNNNEETLGNPRPTWWQQDMVTVEEKI
jgi:hypothetical protein